MEKLEKAKHNHKLTDILKVFTFALVLLFPFLVFMPSAFYYGFNEHAQIEIPQKVAKYQTNEVNTLNDLILGNVYHMNKLNIYYLTENPFKLKFLHIENIVTNTHLTFENIENYVINNYDSKNNNYITFIYNAQNMAIKMSNNNGNIETTIKEDSDFDLINVDFIIYENVQNFIEYIEELADTDQVPTSSNYQDYEINETTTISENLSNSWENMWQTPLFAWTNNTPFTATTNAFASVFNISQQSGIYNLLAYFITITGIYLVIDIVIGVATMLTHMISKQD